MHERQAVYTWPLRYTIERNTVDFILRFEAETGLLSVGIPLFKLPPEVRKLSMKALKHDSEARIKSFGQRLILETLLVVVDEAGPAGGQINVLAPELGPLLEDSLQRRHEAVTDELQAYIHQQLGLVDKKKKARAEIALALRRLVYFEKSTPKESSKAAGILLRDNVDVAVALIDSLFALYEAEQKRQLLSRFERAKSKQAKTFLLAKLATPQNETYAEGIVAGLNPYQDQETFVALTTYSKENRSHSPRTLAGIARWLATYPASAAEDSLKYLLASTNLQVAKAAAKALRQRQYSRADILAEIDAKLHHPELPVRAAAWAVLEDLEWTSEVRQGELWRRFLDNLLKHPMAGVNGMAPAILKHLPLENLVPRMQAALQHPAESVRAGMLFLLERLKNRKRENISEPLLLSLIPLLEDEAYEVRRAIGHILSGLLRQPLSEAVTTELLTIYERSGGKQELLLTLIGCWVVLFQYNAFDSRVESYLLQSIEQENRPVLLAAWRLLRSSTNAEVQNALASLKGAGKLKK